MTKTKAIATYAWADAFGVWHAVAATASDAQRAIKAEIYARETKTDGTTPADRGYRVRVQQIGPHEWIEATNERAQ